MKIAILGDFHYYALDGNEQRPFHASFFSTVIKEFFKTQCDYYISIGDLTNNGSPQEFSEVYSLINPFEKAGKFRQILGNHDSITQSKSELQKQLGYPLYWSVDHDEAKLIFLDTTLEKSPHNYSGFIDDTQLQWLEKEIAASGTKPVLIFAHHPIYNTTDDSDRKWMYISNYEEVENILRQKQGVGIFINGHNHTHSIAKKNQWYFVQSAAVLCSLSYKIVEVNRNEINIDTVFINDDELDEHRYLTAAHMDNFELIPSERSDGKPSDRSVKVNLQRETTY